MARRRLNKKVALLGTAVFVLLATTAVVAMLSGRRDPAQLVADADAAFAAKDYESARRDYAEAFEATESLDQKVELLFKLSEVYQATGDWRRVLACWGQVITANPKNLSARLGRLKYAYILADSLTEFGQAIDSYWKDVSTQATELIELAEGEGLWAQEKTVWEPNFAVSEPPGWDSGFDLMGPYLYFLKGRAAYELASMGAVTAPERSLEEARTHLGKSRALNPKNPAVYRYLAAAALEAGQIAASRSNLDERQTAIEAAEAVLLEGVAAAPDVPSAHVNVLARKLSLAQGGVVADVRTKMRSLEPEYQALVERFPSSAEAWAAGAEFHSYYAAALSFDAGRDKLERAIEAARKAVTLDPATIKYARFAATLYYRKASLYGDEVSLDRAIELAQATLKRPEVRDTPGPCHYVVLAERLSLCSLLATSCVERLQTLSPDAPERSGLLSRAESAVHEIEQIQGSGDNPQVVKWQGMLELARGHRDSAVRKLYTAYEQIKASSPADEADAFLSYTLGKVFERTAEVGAVIEFLESALYAGIATTRPDVLLDYGRALLYAGLYDAALNAVNSFDERFGSDLRSRQLRVRTLIAGGHLTEAEAHLTPLAPADPNTLRLRLSLLGAKAVQLQEAIQRAESPAQLNGVMTDADDPAGVDQDVRAMKAELSDYRRQQAQIAGQLWQQEVDITEEEHLALLCEALIGQNETAAAKDIVAVFLRSVPNSATALFYRGLLAEPDPLACTPSRRQEIRLQAIDGMSDPVARAMALGAFYQDNDRLDEAIAQWRQVLSATEAEQAQARTVLVSSKQLHPRHAAAGQLFDAACYREDWQLAEELVKAARADDLDGCGGHLYAGRLAFARDRQKEALKELDECLRLRPVFSYGYMLRGNIHAAAGNERASIDDTRRASHLNPVDPVVAKALANALLARNRKLGGNVTEEYRSQARRALEHAIRLNPRDTQVLIAYAELIDDSEPLKALAIRQTIQANAPCLANAVRLGRLATNAALKESDDTRRQALFAMAENAFEQARQIEPGNALLLDSYAEYYRAQGRHDKARQLLVESQDGRLLWRHYLRLGRYDEARALLEQMLEEQTDETDALKGLVLVAEATGDKQGVKQYAERLLAVEDTVGNRLAQIRTYLNTGLVQDARYKLQSLKERYPHEPRLGLLEALLAKRQGQLPRALELANRNLEKNPRDASAWRLRGRIYLLSGDVDQAIASLDKSASLESCTATTLALAKAFVWAGRDNDAVNELREAIDGPAAPREVFTLLERLYERQGRDDTLGQLYAQALSRWPDSIVWLTRAGAFAIDQCDYTRAADYYEKACRLSRDETLAHAPTMRDMQHGVALDGYLHALILSAAESDNARRDETLEKVLREANRYVDTPYTAIVLCRMAEAKKAQADATAAQAYGRAALERVWDDEAVAPEVLTRLDDVLGPQEVSEYCRQRWETETNSPAANRMMSDLARVRGDYDGAVGYVDKAMAQCDVTDQQRIRWVLRKADIWTEAYEATSEKCHLLAAIDVYESLAAQMPTSSNVRNNLAYLWAQADSDLSRALDSAGKALAADPDNAFYLDTYAYVLHKNGRNAEAAEVIVAAIQQYEIAGNPPATAYEHMGMIEEALGHKENALAAYRYALHVAGGADSDAARERIRLAAERLP